MRVREPLVEGGKISSESSEKGGGANRESERQNVREERENKIQKESERRGEVTVLREKTPVCYRFC